MLKNIEVTTKEIQAKLDKANGHMRDSGIAIREALSLVSAIATASEDSTANIRAAYRRELVVSLAEKGWKHQSIGEVFGIGRTQVSRILMEAGFRSMSHMSLIESARSGKLAPDKRAELLKVSLSWLVPRLSFWGGNTIGDAVSLTWEELLACPNIGKKMATKIRSQLRDIGLDLRREEYP